MRSILTSGVALMLLSAAAFAQEGKIDYILFHNFLDHALKQLDFEASRDADSASYVPFAATIIGLEEARRNGHQIDSEASAATLTQLKKHIEALQKQTPSAPA